MASDWADDTEQRALTGGATDWADDEEAPYASPIQAGGGATDWADDEEPPATAPPTPLPVGTFDFPDDLATPARYALTVFTDWEDDTPKPYLQIVADAYAYCTRSSAQVFATGTSARIAFEDFWTNDGSVFATSTDGSTVSNASGDTFLLLQKVGFYLVCSELHWATAGNYGRYGIVDLDTALGFGLNAHQDANTPTQLAADGVSDLWDRDVKPLAFAASGGLPGAAALRGFQNSGGNRSTDTGRLIAFYVPMTVDSTSDQVY